MDDTSPRKPPRQYDSTTHPGAPPSSPPSIYLHLHTMANQSVSELSVTSSKGGHPPSVRPPPSVRSPPSVRPPPSVRSNATARGPRPQPQRIDTFPVIQSVTRPNHTRTNSVPDTGPGWGTEVPSSNPAEPVVSVPRTRHFRIEDTPTTTDGFPALAMRAQKPPGRRKQTYDSVLRASMTPVAPSSDFRHDEKVSIADSDSLLSRPRPTKKHSVPSAPSLKAPSVRSARSASIPGSIYSFETAQSIAGSSHAPLSPMSPAAPSSSLEGTLFGNDRSRTGLFPAVVRAAGYTGVPHKTGR